MLFNSLTYTIFLPIVFAIYWLLRKSVKWQNVFLLLASYVFYAWWDWRFLGLLFGMSFLSWFGGRKIANTPEGGQCQFVKKSLLVSIIVIDLMILGAFKYYNFFVGSFADLFGLQNSIHSLKIVLPLGISFFTFQAIAYVVDVYKRKIEPTNLVDCLLYIGFFPKLLAGPIERPTNLLPQFLQKRTFSYEQGVDGMRQILWGLFKKIVIADNAALYVNQVYGDYAHQSGSTLLLAAILYTIQIYGDFSGYSEMAIGTAKLFGFRFRDNFLFPYFSRNMNEFWRRWHISLNTWFVDYVYIPLGGSRNGKWHTIRNIMIVFLLSGLWHGADWSFVAWGAYHGLLLVLLIVLNRNTKYEHVVAYNRWYPSLKELGQMVLVYVLATIGWILFRAETIGQALDFLQGIFSSSLLSIPYHTREIYVLFFYLAVMFVVEWVQRDKHHGLEVRTQRYKWLRYLFYYALVVAIVLSMGSEKTFIYTQF